MLFNFRITMLGRIEAPDRDHAVARLKYGISLSLPVHDALDDLVFDTSAAGEQELAELRERFK